MKLTSKQQKFVESYVGNATEAARSAGYLQPHSQGSRLLENVEILKAIEARERKPRELRIATREERQHLWTEIMFDPQQRMVDRLKASELLGKSNADFSDKLIHQGEKEVKIHFTNTIVHSRPEE